VSDYRLAYSEEFGALDLVVEDDDLSLDEGLETADLVSLYCHRRAANEDVVADESDRRGWWGDTFAEEPGDQIGSRLWLLERGLLTPDYGSQAARYAEEALAWMVSDGVAESASAVATTNGATRSAELLITISRPSGDTVEFRFSSLWESTLAV